MRLYAIFPYLRHRPIRFSQQVLQRRAKLDSRNVFHLSWNRLSCLFDFLVHQRPILATKNFVFIWISSKETNVVLFLLQPCAPRTAASHKASALVSACSLPPSSSSHITNRAQAFIEVWALAITQKQAVVVRRNLLTNLKVWRAFMLEP